MIIESFCSKNKKATIGALLGTIIIIGIVIAVIMMFYTSISVRSHRSNRIQYTIKNDDNPNVKSITDIQEGSFIVQGKGGV